MAQQNEEGCKYCHEPADEEEGGSFVMPCACRTPLHHRCLFQWLASKRCSECEICRQPWQGLVQVSVESLLGALGPAQQADGAAQQDRAALFQVVLDAVNSSQLLMSRALVQALLPLQLELEQAEALAAERDRQLGAAQEQVARLQARLQAAEEAVELSEGAGALMAVLERARRAEAGQKAVSEHVTAANQAKKEAQERAQLAWEEKDRAEQEFKKLQRENDNMRMQLQRLTDQQAWQAKRTQQGQQAPGRRSSSGGQLAKLGLAALAGVLATALLGPHVKKVQPELPGRRQSKQADRKSGSRASA